ncbi:MAG: proprotein convertase P-domain-containing protein [Proteobacteria bacterium]|nr:proprotein convertase P-domain-containing protein [Pseudomonadota bacterium]
MAETWDLTSTQANLASISASSAPSLVILDNATITDTITFSSGIRIDHIEVDLDLTHTWLGDIIITLTSPDETTSVLVNRPGVSGVSLWGASQDDIDFTLTSTHHWGEVGAETWTLAVTDLVGGDSGVLNNWTLRLLGDSLTTDDTYVYTDEFGAFTGAGDDACRVLSNSEGIDTLNAAAVTSDSIIDLNPGANGTLAGNSLVIASGTVIENVYAGDGNDLLTGNSADNSLHGGRGDDVLSGGDGSDYLVGGSGDDILSGGGGNNYFDAGSGANRFVVGAGEASDTISVSDSASSTDILQFVGGIGLSDVGFTQSSNDLTITLSETHGGGGAVSVSDFFTVGGA